MANEAKIKLSAEGVEQVVNAFKKVQQEAARTGTEGAKGIGALNKSLSGLKTIVAAVGIGALIVHLKEKAKAAIEAADAVGDLAAITGATAETISVLAFAMKEAGQEPKNLEKGIINIAKALDDLQRGEPGARDLFNRLQLSAKDFKGLNFDESLRKIILRLGQMDGSQRSVSVASGFLSKKNIELLEVLRNLAEEGFENTRKRAEKLGAIFSDDMTQAADKAKKALGDLQAKSEAATAQFLFGLAPGATKAADVIEKAFGTRSASGFKRFGEAIGWVITKLALFYDALTSLVGGEFAAEFARIRGGLEAIAKLSVGDFAGAKAAFKQGLKDAASISDEAVKKSFKAGKQFFGVEPTPAPAETPEPPTKRQTPGGGPTLADISKAAKAREELEKAALDNELKLFAAKRALQSDQEKRDFDNGLASLEKYFEERRAAITEASAEEISILERKQKIVRAEPVREPGDAEKKAKELAELTTQIDLKRLETQGKLNDLAQVNRVEVRELGKELLQFDNQLLTLQGERFAVQRAALIEEVKQARLLLVKQGLGDSEQARKLGVFEVQGLAAIDFDQQKEKAEAALHDLDRQAAEIRRSVETGVLGQIEGEERIVALQQQRLPLLDAIAKKLGVIAERTGDTQKVEQANQFKDAVADVGVAANKTGRDLAEVRAAIESSSGSARDNFLNDIITRSKEAGEAVNEFSKSVVQSFLGIISKKLSEKLFNSLFGGLGDLGGGILGLFGVGSTTTSTGGQSANLKAEGGKIIGPGTGTSDSIPAIGPMGRLFRVSNNEFIVRAAVVQQPGVEAFLHQLNRGLRMPAIREFSRAPRFAGGGKVGGTSLNADGIPAVRGVQVVISPDMAHMTLRDWLEGHLTRELANR